MAAQVELGLWHLLGEEGLQQDVVKAAALFREAAGLGHMAAQTALAVCYSRGQGVQQCYALAVEWGRKAADQGDAGGQFFVGNIYARGEVGVKKDLPLGKRYLELTAEQGFEDAIALLKELRKCASCGKLDVHHMFCAWCRNVRYCGGTCQLRHWHWHKPHCGRRREVAGGSPSEPTAADDERAMDEATAAAAKMEEAKAVDVAARAAMDAALAEAEVTAVPWLAALTAVKAAKAAAEAAPVASKKDKKNKAKLVAKVKAAETAAQVAATGARSASTAAQAAVEAASAATAAFEAAISVQRAATAPSRAAHDADTAVLEGGTTVPHAAM